MSYSSLHRWGAGALGAFVGAVAAFGAVGASASGPVALEGRGIGDGVYSESQASRGGRVYRQACASCHAVDLQGNEMGPGLAGAAFLGGWEGASLAELMTLVRLTMPQDNPGGLSEEEYLDVVAYMLQANEFPSGEDDLTIEAIEDIVIEPGE